jgi:hypothetical protein
MSKFSQRAHPIRENASKRLLLRIRILSVVYVVLLIMTIYSAINSHAILWKVILGLCIGIIVGVISSRMFKISWDKDGAEVIGKIDVYGVIVLVLFIVFEVNRNNIAGLFDSGESLGAIVLTLVTGTLFGRILGITRQILRVVRSRK